MLVLKGLRSVRERKLLTMRDLAARSGVGTATLVRLERHGYPARISTVRRLTEALGCTVEELLGTPGQGSARGD